MNMMKRFILCAVALICIVGLSSCSKEYKAKKIVEEFVDKAKDNPLKGADLYPGISEDFIIGDIIIRKVEEHDIGACVYCDHIYTDKEGNRVCNEVWLNIDTNAKMILSSQGLFPLDKRIRQILLKTRAMVNTEENDVYTRRHIDMYFRFLVWLSNRYLDDYIGDTVNALNALPFTGREFAEYINEGNEIPYGGPVHYAG